MLKKYEQSKGCQSRDRRCLIKKKQCHSFQLVEGELNLESGAVADGWMAAF